MKKLTEEEKKSFEVDCFGKSRLTERDLVKKYKISKGTVSRLKKELEIQITKREKLKVNTSDNYDKIDNQTFEVFSRLRSRNIPLNGPVIKSISLKIAAKLGLNVFKASNGWLDNFKKRHSLSFKNISGESKSADESCLPVFREKLEQAMLKYDVDDIFNCDETALYYKNLPRKSFVAENDECKGIKGNKTRITIMLTCSMSGEKLKPLVIGHFKSPRPMKGFDPLDVGVQYTYSAKAWMTSVLFKTYLYELNEDLKRNKRKILLLLDNAPSHPCVELSNIELMFLPKNTTSIIQPLDMGIIKALKAHYFNALVDSIGYDMLSQDSDCIHSPNIKDAILLISIAWDNVSKETIKHCFDKGLKENLGCSTTDEVDEKLETLIEFAVEEVYDEALVLEEDETSIEEIVNDTDQRDLIKSALFHFESFYSAAEKLFSSNLKELLILKIEMVREWRKKFGFGSKITDFLIKKNE